MGSESVRGLPRWGATSGRAESNRRPEPGRPTCAPPADCSRLCLHTITTKPWGLAEAVARYAAAGIGGITVWEDALGGMHPREAARMIRDHGLAVVSFCRGGFFAARGAPERERAWDENRRCVDLAADLGAPQVVLVGGSAVGQSLAESRRQIAEGIAAVLPHAAAAGVKLAIEPLHPMYAGDRSAITSLGQAREICRQLASPFVGITADAFHLWWDEGLEEDIKRCGSEGWLLAFHLSDWRTPMTDFLNDRALMGEGCIPLRRIRGWMEAAGFRGFHEVEIFSNHWWAQDQQVFLDRITDAYRRYC